MLKKEGALIFVAIVSAPLVVVTRWKTSSDTKPDDACDG
jgi:hypothetical protein